MNFNLQKTVCPEKTFILRSKVAKLPKKFDVTEAQAPPEPVHVRDKGIVPMCRLLTVLTQVKCSNVQSGLVLIDHVYAQSHHVGHCA